jgi:hypothetical protein
VTATPFCARRSAVYDSVRDPVNCQTMITLASRSMVLSSAQPIRAIDPTAKPAMRPKTASAVIQASDAHASQRAPGVLEPVRVRLVAEQAQVHAHGSESVLGAVLDGCEDITMRAYRSPFGAVLLTVMLATICVYRRTYYPTWAKNVWP